MGSEEEGIIYYFETTSIVPQVSTHGIVYSWQKTLEEPSSKEVYPYVILLERQEDTELVKLGGVLEEITVNEEDIEEAKHSLFKYLGE